MGLIRAMASRAAMAAVKRQVADAMAWMKRIDPESDAGQTFLLILHTAIEKRIWSFIERDPTRMFGAHSTMSPRDPGWLSDAVYHRLYSDLVEAQRYYFLHMKEYRRDNEPYYYAEMMASSYFGALGAQPGTPGRDEIFGLVTALLPADEFDEGQSDNSSDSEPHDGIEIISVPKGTLVCELPLPDDTPDRRSGRRQDRR